MWVEQAAAAAAAFRHEQGIAEFLLELDPDMLAAAAAAPVGCSVAIALIILSETAIAPLELSASTYFYL